MEASLPWLTALDPVSSISVFIARALRSAGFFISAIFAVTAADDRIQVVSGPAFYLCQGLFDQTPIISYTNKIPLGALVLAGVFLLADSYLHIAPKAIAQA